MLGVKAAHARPGESALGCVELMQLAGEAPKVADPHLAEIRELIRARRHRALVIAQAVFVAAEIYISTSI